MGAYGTELIFTLKEPDMSSAEMQKESAVAGMIDMKLEVVVIPVSDADRAKRFYGDLGWRLDIDYTAGDDFRVIQFMRPAPDARSSSARTRYLSCAWLSEGAAFDRL